MATVTICSDFGAQENKICHCFHCFPSICHELMGLDDLIFIFWMLRFKPAFSLSSFTFIMLVGLCSKSFKLSFSSAWIENSQMYKLNFEEAQEPEIKLPKSTGSWRKQGNFRKPSTSALLTMLKPLTVWITANCGKFFKRWEYQTNLLVSWEMCIQVKNNYNWTYNNRLVPNWERGMVRQIVTLLI